uniref:Alpha-endosulfine n=1 Tax=Glossina morsitans morsitans TaxID=37546 RepID=A0A1B0FQ84_GLOMM
MDFSTDNDNNRVATNNESSEEHISSHEMERREEEKLKAKYPILRNSNINNIMVMKRLHKRQKYFDSGDYQMAKQKGHDVSQVLPNIVTGDIIPTAERLRVRKSSTIQGKCSFTQCNKPETPS